ncbi:MAG: hypothetical protein WBW31_04545 [Candidatus Sulfotelmatobacter sp.]
MSQLFPRICLPQIILPQIIAVALLSATVAAAAGTVCLLPVASTPFSNAGCHHGQAPANPQPVDYRCCFSHHPSAITTAAFSPRPALRAQDALHVDIGAANSDAIPVVSFTPSSSPPVCLMLRI